MVNPCCWNWVNLHVKAISWWPQLTESGFSLSCVQFLKIINKRYDFIFSVNVSNNIETERVNMQVAPLVTAFHPLLSPDTNTVNSCAWLLPGVYQGDAYIPIKTIHWHMYTVVALFIINVTLESVWPFSLAFFHLITGLARIFFLLQYTQI